MRYVPLLLLGFSLLSNGCAGETDETEAASEADLSPSRIMVLGTIAKGQTLSTPYTPTPRYRAYAFTAQAGENVDFWIRSERGNPYGYLLGPSFSTIVGNRDASPGDASAHVSATLPRAGTYYVAFRDENGASAQFDVTFSGTAQTIPVCSGTPRYPTTGLLLATKARRYEFTRSCDAFGVCSAWTHALDAEVTPRSPSGAQTGILPEKRAYIEFLNGSRPNDSYPSATGTCYDSDSGSLVRLDDAGQGDLELTAQSYCPGGRLREQEPRKAHASYGSSCLSVTEDDPSVAYGVQKKLVYIARFD